MRDYITLCKLRAEAKAKTEELYLQLSIARSELSAITEELATLCEIENSKKRATIEAKAIKTKIRVPKIKKVLTPEDMLAMLDKCSIEELIKLLNKGQ